MRLQKHVTGGTSSVVGKSTKVLSQLIGQVLAASSVLSAVPNVHALTGFNSLGSPSLIFFSAKI